MKNIKWCKTVGQKAKGDVVFIRKVIKKLGCIRDNGLQQRPVMRSVKKVFDNSRLMNMLCLMMNLLRMYIV